MIEINYGTTFGKIVIDGRMYDHDVVIRFSGEIIRRKKRLSKRLYGTSHTLSKDEAKFLFEKGCEQIIIGSGQFGNVHLSPEAEAYFAKHEARIEPYRCAPMAGDGATHTTSASRLQGAAETDRRGDRCI